MSGSIVFSYKDFLRNQDDALDVFMTTDKRIALRLIDVLKMMLASDNVSLQNCTEGYIVFALGAMIRYGVYQRYIDVALDYFKES
jgi:hypothetical protein